MKLDLLLKRENFPKIFVDTLASYLKNRLDWEGEIFWRNNFFWSARLLVIPKLNLIFPKSFSTSILRSLSLEYAFHPNIFFRKLQGVYIKCASIRLLRFLFSSSWIRIDPWPVAASGWCILPGNHSIRIIDVVQDKCIVLRKIDARREFMSALVSIRKEFPDLPGPRLLDVDLDAGWYEEERIEGLPLNRTLNQVLVEEALHAAHLVMTSLYSRTGRAILLDDWLGKLLRDIQQEIAVMPSVYDAKFRFLLKNVATSFANVLKTRLGNGVSIRVAMTHGDFQDANILIPLTPSSYPVFLIDWEYAASRWHCYDALTHEFSSRSPVGMAQRISSWKRDRSRQVASLNWCGFADYPKWNASELVACYLLEDLLLRLKDASIPGLRNKSSGLLLFLEEVKSLSLDN